mmetsp:Transcript_8658/g.18075  ORF Transcript_8658/g.18075 Transcript_8658/m.18075 type:complete len:202 (-) Transcript_8658:980-1585(-)
MPHWIQAKWIHRFIRTIFCELVGNITFFNLQIILTIKFPTTFEEVETERETIIVHQTGIHGEKSHHGNHVSSHMESFRQLVSLNTFSFLLVPYQHASIEEQKHTMTNITIHHSEKEWEGSRGKEGWIGFSITGDSIRVNKLLIGVGEFVGYEVRRRSRPRLRNVVDKTGHRHIHVCMSLLDGKTNLIEVFTDNPTFSAEHT